MSYWTGKKHTEESKAKISASRVGEKNPNWKGDDVGYAALHEWINNNALIPEKCERCGRRTRLDAANKSGKYLKDVSDYEWLCRKCHMVSDGRLERLVKRMKARRQYPQPASCEFCQKKFMRKRKGVRFCGYTCVNYHRWYGKQINV